MGLQEYTTNSGQFTAQVSGNHTIILIGGGGGGAGGNGAGNKYGGGGGGGGACCIKVVSLTQGQNYNYAVGTAGTAGTKTTNGGNGGASTFVVAGTTYTAGGGGGGKLPATYTGGAGGTASNGDTNRTGGTGGTGTAGSGSGGGGGAAGTTANGKNGNVPTAGNGTDLYGGGGGVGTTANSANGTAATASYGGGGGGGTNNGTGAAGMSGYVRIEWTDPIPLSGAANVSISATGELVVTTTEALSGQADVVVSATGTLRDTKSLSGTVAISVSASASLSVSLGESFLVQSAAASATGFCFQRKLARSSNGDLHCVYHRSDGSYQQIYYAKSDDGGQTWNETKLTTDAYVHYYPTLAVDSSDHIHVAFIGKHAGSPDYYQIGYRKYTDSWQDVEYLTSGDYHQYYPAIAIESNGHIHLVWCGTHSDSASINQVRHVEYTDSWQAIENLTSEDYDQYYPCIAIGSNDYLHLVWRGKHSGSTTVIQLRYRRYAAEWEAIENLTSESYEQFEASIAVDSNNYLHVCWSGKHDGSTTKDQIRYVKYTDSWQAIENITSGNYNQCSGTVAVDGDNGIHLVWHGFNSDHPADYQIRYCKYTDGWQAIEELTDQSSPQTHANVIWALHPTVNGAKTNRPDTGFAFIWTANAVIRYYRSFDLTWDEEALLLSGKSDAVMSTSGALSVTKSIEGAAAVSVSTEASLSTTKGLSGASQVTISASGSLENLKALSGQSDIGLGTSASLLVSKNVTGQSDVSIVASGSLSVTRGVAGQAGAALGISGTLSATKELSGSSAVDISCVGSLSNVKVLSGQSDIAVTASGPLFVTKNITSQANLSVSMSAVLSLMSDISGQSDAAVSATGSLSVTKNIAGQANIEVSASGNLLAPGRDYSREASDALGSDDTDLETAFSQADYDAVEADDEDRLGQVANTGQYAVFLFKDAHTQQEQFSVCWNGQSSLAASSSPVVLQVYNRNTPAWETLDSNDTENADTDFTLQGSKSESLDDYFDGSFEIACRVYQQIS